MRKADYIKIADVIAELINLQTKGQTPDLYDLVEYFGAMLSEDNSAFNHKKFVEYIDSKLV